MPKMKFKCCKRCGKIYPTELKYSQFCYACSNRIHTHFRTCERCQKVFKTTAKYGHCCDQCKINIRSEADKKRHKDG